MKKIILSLSLLLSSLYMEKSEAIYLDSSCEQAKKRLSSLVSSTLSDQVKLQILIAMNTAYKIQFNPLDSFVELHMNRIVTAKLQYQNKKSTEMDKNNSYAVVTQSLQALLSSVRKVASPADIHNIALEILYCANN
ncbi:MAG: hypothetical protein L6Q37_06710 [Bdellovibrionaceae bacterium]|nr:hypothetical protein [Pseudobdellovibrionaceae bacterium]NUM58641.1 hypothetical protein [Pseudobdellovibrionaceae bacterium]